MLIIGPRLTTHPQTNHYTALIHTTSLIASVESNSHHPHPHSSSTQDKPQPIQIKPKPTPPIEFYIAYAQSDDRFLQAVQDLLEVLQLQGYPITYHKSLVWPGQDWENDDYLSTARVILLLVSMKFLRSKFCYREQMAKAVARHRNKDCYVVPILLHDISSELLIRTPFSELQFLPDNEKTVQQLGTQKSIHLISNYLFKNLRNFGIFP